MIVQSIELVHLAIPFITEFRHAKKARSYSDTILVLVTTSSGSVGIGEILPRLYVSGESVSEIMQTHDCPLLQSVIGREFTSQEKLRSWVLQQLESAQWGVAKFGGLELALWNAFSQEHSLDLDSLIGPLRQSAKGHCITIGFDAGLQDLRARAIHAKLQKATVVKLKIGLDDDAERINTLNKAFNGKMPIRLDANGCSQPDSLVELLKRCADVPIHSVEQPFDASDEKLTAHLDALYAETRVPLMADESLCTLQDAQHLIEAGGYQYFNLRVGKHGGVVAAGVIRDAAAAAGIELVGGSMVGESGILTAASVMILNRSEELPYIEGLGQNESFLTIDPVERFDQGPERMDVFQFRRQACESILVAAFVLH